MADSKISYFILTVSEMEKKGKVDDYNLGRAVFKHNLDVLSQKNKNTGFCRVRTSITNT